MFKLRRTLLDRNIYHRGKRVHREKRPNKFFAFYSSMLSARRASLVRPFYFLITNLGQVVSQHFLSTRCQKVGSSAFWLKVIHPLKRDERPKGATIENLPFSSSFSMNRTYQRTLSLKKNETCV